MLVSHMNNKIIIPLDSLLANILTSGKRAVNPFGQKEFPHPEAAEQGAVTIKKGDSITLRYLVWLHKGTLETAALESEFSKFSEVLR